MKSKLLLERLLGTELPDPGCDPCFEVLDRYVEAVLRGDDVESLFPQVVAHLKQCDACREDTEGFIEVLRSHILESNK